MGAMSDTTRITRTVDTDLDAADLWALVGDGDGWARWMVDEADVDVRPGAEGTVVDDGVERAVRIDRLDRSRVGFTWWPQDRPELVSAVELTVAPSPGGSTLRVTETFSACATTTTAERWDGRLFLLLEAPALV